MNTEQKFALTSLIRTTNVEEINAAFEVLYQASLIIGTTPETRFLLTTLAQSLDAKFDGQRVMEIIEMVNILPQADGQDLRTAISLLEFANNELSITQPYADPESEYDECRVCGHREFAHDPNCKGVEWKSNVQKFLKELK